MLATCFQMSHGSIPTLGKEEALMKDMETTLAKLKEVLAYLEDMGEEKAEEDEEEGQQTLHDADRLPIHVHPHS